MKSFDAGGIGDRLTQAALETLGDGWSVAKGMDATRSVSHFFRSRVARGGHSYRGETMVVIECD